MSFGTSTDTQIKGLRFKRTLTGSIRNISKGRSHYLGTVDYLGTEVRCFREPLFILLDWGRRFTNKTLGRSPRLHIGIKRRNKPRS